MATLRPSQDRPRQLPRSHFWTRLLSVLSLSSLVLAIVAAASLWLLITDPVTAAAVMERGTVVPVLGALAKIVGKAFAALLALL